MKKLNFKLLLVLALAVTLALCIVACDNDAQHSPLTPQDPTPSNPQDPPTTTHTHEYIPVAARQADCRQEGCLDHFICSCGKYFVVDDETGEKVEVDREDVILQKLPHTPMGSLEANAQQHWDRCQSCGEIFDIEDHVAGDWEQCEPATCYSLPKRAKSCVDCGYPMVGPEEYGEMLPHVYESEWHIEDEEYTCGDTVTRFKQCVNCTDRQTEQYTVQHEIPEEWTIDGQHTCGETVTRYKKCGRCQQTMEEDTNYVIEHEWQRNGGTRTCDNCGTTENIYSFETTPSGRVVIFGSYPQTIVTEDSGDGVLANLMQISGSAPTESDHGKWSIGQGKSGAPTSIMWYMDVTFNGEKYRGVYTPATQYLPEEYNWFKWEPIKWRVIDQSANEAFLLSDVILDNKYFYRNKVEVRQIDGERVTQSNYYHSDVRAWLIGEFFDWAFDEVEQSVIKTTLVECRGVEGKFRTMEDKVFLLGEDEIQNPEYGFNNYGQTCESLVRMETDYAMKGTKRTTPQRWWLNYPSIAGTNGVMNVREDGKRNQSVDVNSYLGVVPALKIELA